MRRVVLLLLLVSLSYAIPQRPALAQRGQLIEDLFRTIADAQLEREQRKRAEAERAAAEARRRLPPEGTTQPFPIPRPGPGARPDFAGRGSINVRSREAAAFAQNLVSFDGAINPLVNDLRNGASNNLALRGILPEAYQVAADSRALLQRCDGLGAMQPIVDPYSELDSRWRQLSFKLRSLDGLSAQCTTHIRTCDDVISKMARQLSIQPQFDRHRLRDNMVVAATYMQTLMDDLQIARLPRANIDRLLHDCRLLRQRLLVEADAVHDTSYEEVVTRFTDFASRWAAFSEQVYPLHNPHLQRRLDRIRDLADETYALLWMPPPYSGRSLTASAQRLQQSGADLLDQLTFRTMVSLDRQQQVRVLEASHRMYQTSRELAEATTGRASRDDLRRNFRQIDEDWAFLRPRFYKMSSLNRATLSSVDHECSHLRGALGLGTPGVPPIVHEELIDVAAGLEGAAEYLIADVRRYERYLQPVAYRRSMITSCDEFHLHAKQLHAQLSRGAELSILQREADLMLDGWRQFSEDLSRIEAHGLSARRAQTLQRAHQELVPQVAKMAAALAVGR